MGNILKSYLTVTRYTLIELIKSRILVSVITLGVILVCLCLIVTEFAYGDPKRIAIDVGLGLLAICNLGIAVFMGVGLIKTEIENRTIYMVLSRPISRSVYILGKFSGMALIFIINTVILSFMTLGIYVILGGEFNTLIFWAIGFVYLESILMLVIVLLLSLMVNNVLTVLISLLIYVFGQALSDGLLQKLSETNKVFYHILNTAKYFIPDLNRINIRDFVLYEKNLDLSFLVPTLGYGLLYLIAFLIFSCLVFERKNLD